LAKERLAEIQAEREAEMKPEPETNAGYTITERATVGKTLFVLGERPDGNCVTWQRYEGRECYDHGHYFESREKAAADLRRRAGRERDALENRTRNPRNTGDAR
jgi:hypothetical protein